MLGIARPELLPGAPFGQFLREDATARIKRMRAQAYREDFPEATAAPPTKQPKKPKLPRAVLQRGRDPTVYLFVLPEGEEVACTRSELQARVPRMNSGSLLDLVHGRIRSAYGVRCLGQAKARQDIAG